LACGGWRERRAGSGRSRVALVIDSAANVAACAEKLLKIQEVAVSDHKIKHDELPAVVCLCTVRIDDT